MVVDAVGDELVSTANSLLSGKITEKSGKIGPERPFALGQVAQLPAFSRKFPNYRNREGSRQTPA
jgi:hypothetical protein